MGKGIFGVVCLSVLLCTAAVVFGAYQHEGEEDSPRFLAVYPATAGTKLDHCATCHTGGQYDRNGRLVSLGSCQWCHYSYGYDASGSILQTLNEYGKAYAENGRSTAALTAIETLDSDGDGFTNLAEILAIRFPGNPADDPDKMPAPYRIYTREELEYLPWHTQFLLMNTSRSGDFYAEYSGVAVEDILDDAGASAAASGITVYAPDGFATYHPMDPDPDPSLYHVRGVYPVTPADIVYHYDDQADQALNPADGWCDYSAPSCAGRSSGDLINNPAGLKMILAIKREGGYMEPGFLDDENRLDGEGPFRVVPPQKVPSPPDQSSRATNQAVTWPYNNDWDHNAGFSSRTVTMIRVEPLPEWATDIDVLEAGWNFVDQQRIIVYGALDAAATLDPDFDLNLWKVEYAGVVYQAALARWSNPDDQAGLYWRLSRVALGPEQATGAETAVIDPAHAITVPDVAFFGMRLALTLGLFENPADPTVPYWKLQAVALDE